MLKLLHTHVTTIHTIMFACIIVHDKLYFVVGVVGWPPWLFLRIFIVVSLKRKYEYITKTFSSNAKIFIVYVNVVHTNNNAKNGAN